MDLEEARRRREAHLSEARDVEAASRAADARLRHGIREAFARQRANGGPEARPPATPLRLVPPPDQRA